MARTPLDEAALEQRLAGLPGWQRRGDRIARGYRFADFRAAFAWMTQVAEVAERLDHHPEWSNVYDRVAVELTTHDAGGLTALDFELAAAMDELAGAAT